MKLLIVGSGTVATALALCIQKNGLEIIHVMSRNKEHACALGERVGASYSDLQENMLPVADICLIAVRDEALPQVVQRLPVMPHTLLIHTAGSYGLEIFEKREHDGGYGVLYPLQTFAKDLPIDFSQVPLFLEADREDSMRCLKRLAGSISKKIYEMDFAQRKWLHIAAVFAHNFSNHCMSQAQLLLQSIGLPFKVMLPMLSQMIDNLQKESPIQVQTGPARRGDQRIVAAESTMLEEYPSMKVQYDLLSQSISRMYSNQNQERNNNDKL